MVGNHQRPRLRMRQIDIEPDAKGSKHAPADTCLETQAGRIAAERKQA